MDRTVTLDARSLRGRWRSANVGIGNDGVTDSFVRDKTSRISGHTSGSGSLAIRCIEYRREARQMSGEPVQVGCLGKSKLHLGGGN